MSLVKMFGVFEIAKTGSVRRWVNHPMDESKILNAPSAAAAIKFFENEVPYVVEVTAFDRFQIGGQTITEEYWEQGK